MVPEGDRGEQRLIELLGASGALLEGHFELSSGRHSASYVQCARLLEQPERARFAGQELAARLRPYGPESILSPALGGLVIGYEVATVLGLPFRFTERRSGEMVLRRGFELGVGERVVVIEDVVTTGGSTLEAAAVAAACGARVVAVGAIIDRSGDRRPFEVPFEALTRLAFDTWPPEACPLCREGSALRQPGSRTVSS